MLMKLHLFPVLYLITDKSLSHNILTKKEMEQICKI